MNFERLLRTISEKPIQVLDTKILLQKYVSIDLSIRNKDLQVIDITSSKTCETYIAACLGRQDAQVAYGGYLEERNLYKGDDNFIGAEKRNIHLGLDLWCTVGTKILAILDGEIHSFQNNNNRGDYGPTIILKHQIQGIEFHSLYGHLSYESLSGLKVGQRVAQGDIIARLGTAEVNGGYAPHLHFQLIKDVDENFGDYPGVCSKENLDFYKTNCPNPDLLLKIGLNEI